MFSIHRIESGKSNRPRVAAISSQKAENFGNSVKIEVKNQSVVVSLPYGGLNCIFLSFHHIFEYMQHSNLIMATVLTPTKTTAFYGD